MLVRIQKFIAESGISSRRKAEALIQQGEVRVNGKVVTKLGTKIDPEKDHIVVGNKIIKPAPKGVALYHKPRGVVSTLSDPEGRPALGDLLTKQLQSYYPVGRLDYDATGLIVLTNDGEFAEHMMHPRYDIERIYEVRVEGSPRAQDLEKLELGVKLADGMARAEAKILSFDSKTTWLRLKVTEGRNHLVKRLMQKIGHPVVKLKRIGHGPFRLGTLRPGEIKRLSEREFRETRRRVLG